MFLFKTKTAYEMRISDWSSDMCSTDLFGSAIRKSLHITKPKQLEGLKLGVLKGTSAELMVANLAKHYGLDMAKIQLVNLAPPEQLSSLATGALDRKDVVSGQSL